MRNKIIISVICLIIINMLFLNINTVQAAGISDVITGADNFIQAGQSGGASVDTSKLKDTSTSIFNILTTVGMVAAVIMASVLGIQFMIGSAEEKAKVKDSLVVFVIGCIVIFGAFGIWKIAVNILNDL